jgi:hypothetical protein
MPLIFSDFVMLYNHAINFLSVGGGKDCDLLPSMRRAAANDADAPPWMLER